MDAELAERLKAERKKLVEEEARKARAAVSIDLNHKDQQLEELTKAFKEREAKLVEAQKAQAEAVRKQRELAEKEREFDLTVEKRVLEKQAEIRERAKAEAEEALRLKVQEREQTILSMQKQIEDLKRRAEQGSQQLQGEVQELQLEALLRASFPHDTITPVPKGEFGGDAIQLVTTPFGQACGKILWESKRTRNWSDGWLQKLREDQRVAKADAAIIVSQALPKTIETFGQIDGIWITSPKCSVALAIAIRHLLDRGHGRAEVRRGAAIQDGGDVPVSDGAAFPPPGGGHRREVQRDAGRSRKGAQGHAEGLGQARAANSRRHRRDRRNVWRHAGHRGALASGDRRARFRRGACDPERPKRQRKAAADRDPTPGSNSRRWRLSGWCAQSMRALEGLLVFTGGPRRHLFSSSDRLLAWVCVPNCFREDLKEKRLAERLKLSKPLIVIEK